MAKYDENRNIKPDTLLQTIIAIGRMGLVILGIIGISVDLFRDDGWLQQILGKLLNSPMVLLWIFMIIGILYGLDRWMSSTADGKASSRGDLLLNLMMIIGAFFLFRLITAGSI